MYTLQVESSRETGNWAYVVRDHDGRRVLATGDRHFAVHEVETHNAAAKCGTKTQAAAAD